MLPGGGAGLPLICGYFARRHFIYHVRLASASATQAADLENVLAEPKTQSQSQLAARCRLPFCSRFLPAYKHFVKGAIHIFVGFILSALRFHCQLWCFTFICMALLMMRDAR